MTLSSSRTATLSTASGPSTSWTWSGASPAVPTTSSWPSWPIEQDVVVVAGEALGLVVHLGHQRAGGVDGAQVALGGLHVHRRRDPVRGEDHDGSLGNLARSPRRRPRPPWPASRRRARCARSRGARRPGRRASPAHVRRFRPRGRRPRSSRAVRPAARACRRLGATTESGRAGHTHVDRRRHAFKGTYPQPTRPADGAPVALAPMATAPYGVRLLVGAAAIALEETRRLPQTILMYPMTVASQVAQLVCSFQQNVAELVNKGDETLESIFPPKDEQAGVGDVRRGRRRCGAADQRARRRPAQRRTPSRGQVRAVFGTGEPETRDDRPETPKTKATPRRTRRRRRTGLRVADAGPAAGPAAVAEGRRPRGAAGATSEGDQGAVHRSRRCWPTGSPARPPSDTAVASLDRTRAGHSLPRIRGRFVPSP